ncbi:MAG: DUF7144 family membrane protein [Trebonia sp.]
MTSASVRGAKSTDYDEPRGLGLVFFAAIMLLVVGLFNVIDGIAAIANSHVFVANAHYVFGDLRAWGWVVLILGLLQLLAGGGVMVGNQAARWFGIAVIGLNLVAQLFFIPAYPFWALTIIAFDVFALYGLCVYGSRANVTGA